MKKELKDCMTSELLFQAMKENCTEKDKSLTLMNMKDG